MKTIELLKPLPICRDEGEHKYLNKETNEWLAYSTTEVCNELTEEDKEAIESYRYIWQPRGEKVHECLQEKMLGSGEIDMGDYAEIVCPLLDHELFTHSVHPGGGLSRSASVHIMRSGFFGLGFFKPSLRSLIIAA